MAAKIKVLTLNCWGLWKGSKYRSERISAVGAEVSKGEYDIVILEEIWIQADYERLCDQILPVMPYSHYFHSGNFGSGVCIFSKHIITETFQCRFTLNGYAHKIFCGDWFGGKLVGLAKILFGDLRINVYGTHVHAQYEPDHLDRYEAHRLTQAYEMGQFVKNTSEGCDVVILGGDFNFRPEQLGYKIIRCHGNLEDSWVSQRDKQDENSPIGMTCDRPDNYFVSPDHLKKFPNGVRLDYLMYRNNSGFDMTCEKCYVTMQKVPGQMYNYSDHDGVAAIFSVRRNITGMAKQRDFGEVERHLSSALPIISKAEQQVKSTRLKHVAMIILCLTGIIVTRNIQMPFILDLVTTTLRTGMILLGGACAWLCIVMADRELNGLTSVRKDMTNTLRSTGQ